MVGKMFLYHFYRGNELYTSLPVYSEIELSTDEVEEHMDLYAADYAKMEVRFIR